MTKRRSLTEEERRIISEKTKLAMTNPEVRAKISAGKKGKPSWNKGIPNTYADMTGLALGRGWNKDTKGIMKPNQTSFKKGQKPWNYTGQEASPSRIIRNSSEYKIWRVEVFKRDWFSCKVCGYKGRDLEAHHIIPMKIDLNLALDINNGITLCKTCHNKTRYKELEMKQQFIDILEGTGAKGLAITLTFQTP